MVTGSPLVRSAAMTAHGKIVRRKVTAGAGVVEAVSAIPACSSRRSNTFDAIRGLAIRGRSWWVSVRKESWVPEEGLMVGAG